MIPRVCARPSLLCACYTAAGPSTPADSDSAASATPPPPVGHIPATPAEAAAAAVERWADAHKCFAEAAAVIAADPAQQVALLAYAQVLLGTHRVVSMGPAVPGRVLDMLTLPLARLLGLRRPPQAKSTYSLRYFAIATWSASRLRTRPAPPERSRIFMQCRFMKLTCADGSRIYQAEHVAEAFVVNTLRAMALSIFAARDRSVFALPLPIPLSISAPSHCLVTWASNCADNGVRDWPMAASASRRRCKWQ